MHLWFDRKTEIKRNPRLRCFPSNINPRVTRSHSRQYSWFHTFSYSPTFTKLLLRWWIWHTEWTGLATCLTNLFFSFYNLLDLNNEVLVERHNVCTLTFWHRIISVLYRECDGWNWCDPFCERKGVSACLVNFMELQKHRVTEWRVLPCKRSWMSLRERKPTNQNSNIGLSLYRSPFPFPLSPFYSVSLLLHWFIWLNSDFSHRLALLLIQHTICQKETTSINKLGPTATTKATYTHDCPADN